MIQSSLPSSDFDEKHISATDNGLVWAAFFAYSHHHHLVLRPEDVWFAILSQLSFYINAHAEELRDHFVSHKGQKELEIVRAGSISTVDFGEMARSMTGLIQNNIKDPRLQEWIMPSFSTTTDCDRTVAAILMMGTMKKYFTYLFSLTCGIPSVQLLGERKDWENMSTRLDYLTELGSEPEAFARLLRPVLRNLVASFDSPLSASTKQFWGSIAHEKSMGSGPDYLAGWITAFCFWNEDGKMLYDEKRYPGVGCELEDVKYHCVDTDKIPVGFVSVPVTVNDNGMIHHTKMLAGSFGIEAKSSSVPKSDGSEDPQAQGNSTSEEGTHAAGLDTIQPVSGWFMYKVGDADDSSSCASPTGPQYSPTSPTSPYYPPTSPHYSPIGQGNEPADFEPVSSDFLLSMPSFEPTTVPASSEYVPTSPAYMPTHSGYVPTSSGYTSSSFTPTKPVYEPTTPI
jgi:hypothetical protein